MIISIMLINNRHYHQHYPNHAAAYQTSDINIIMLNILIITFENVVPCLVMTSIVCHNQQQIEIIAL